MDLNRYGYCIYIIFALSLLAAVILYLHSSGNNNDNHKNKNKDNDTRPTLESFGLLDDMKSKAQIHLGNMKSTLHTHRDRIQTKLKHQQKKLKMAKPLTPAQLGRVMSGQPIVPIPFKDGYSGEGKIKWQTCNTFPKWINQDMVTTASESCWNCPAYKDKKKSLTLNYYHDESANPGVPFESKICCLHGVQEDDPCKKKDDGPKTNPTDSKALNGLKNMNAKFKKTMNAAPDSPGNKMDYITCREPSTSSKSGYRCKMQCEMAGKDSFKSTPAPHCQIYKKGACTGTSSQTFVIAQNPKFIRDYVEDEFDKSITGSCMGMKPNPPLVGSKDNVKKFSNCYQYQQKSFPDFYETKVVCSPAEDVLQKGVKNLSKQKMDTCTKCDRLVDYLTPQGTGAMKNGSLMRETSCPIADYQTKDDLGDVKKANLTRRLVTDGDEIKCEVYDQAVLEEDDLSTDKYLYLNMQYKNTWMDWPNYKRILKGETAGDVDIRLKLIEHDHAIQASRFKTLAPCERLKEDIATAEKQNRAQVFNTSQMSWYRYRILAVAYYYVKNNLSVLGGAKISNELPKLPKIKDKKRMDQEAEEEESLPPLGLPKPLAYKEVDMTNVSFIQWVFNLGLGVKLNTTVMDILGGGKVAAADQVIHKRDSTNLGDILFFCKPGSDKSCMDSDTPYPARIVGIRSSLQGEGFEMIYYSSGEIIDRRSQGQMALRSVRGVNLVRSTSKDAILLDGFAYGIRLEWILNTSVQV